MIMTQKNKLQSQSFCTAMVDNRLIRIESIYRNIKESNHE